MEGTEHIDFSRFETTEAINVKILPVMYIKKLWLQTQISYPRRTFSVFLEYQSDMLWIILLAFLVHLCTVSRENLTTGSGWWGFQKRFQKSIYISRKKEAKLNCEKFSSRLQRY